MTDRRKAFISVVVGSVLGGAIGSVTKIGLLEIPPLSFAFIRFFLASIFILPFFLQEKMELKKNIFPLIFVSFLVTLNIILYTTGIKKTTATSGQLIYAIVPLLTAIIGYFFLIEKLNLKKVLGVLLGFAGVLLIAIAPLIEKGIPYSGDLVGNLLIAIGAILYSFYMVFSKKLQKEFSPMIITAVFIFLTTIILLPLSIFESFSNHWWNNLSSEAYFSLIYMAFFATVLTYLLNQYAIKHGGSVFASMALYLTPVFTFVIAFFLLGERLTSVVSIGGALALFGVFFTTRK